MKIKIPYNVDIIVCENNQAAQALLGVLEVCRFYEMRHIGGKYEKCYVASPVDAIDISLGTDLGEGKVFGSKLEFETYKNQIEEKEKEDAV